MCIVIQEIPGDLKKSLTSQRGKVTGMGALTQRGRFHREGGAYTQRVFARKLTIGHTAHLEFNLVKGRAHTIMKLSSSCLGVSRVLINQVEYHSIEVNRGC